jgi:hypothetical protein
MPLVIDGSSPAGHTTSTQTNTCAAFTPPDSPLLLGLWAGNSVGGTGPTSGPTWSSSPGQTWVRDNWDQRDTGSPTEDGQSSIGHALVTGTPGSTTVSVVNNATSFWDSILSVLVMTGHDPVDPIGVVGGGRQGGGTTVTATFTASIDGGQGFLCLSDWNAGATTGWAAASGCSFVQSAGADLKGTIAGQVSYAVVKRTTPDEVAGVSTSLGLTSLTSGGVYHWSYAEVISIEAAEAAQLLRTPVDAPDPAGFTPPPSQIF